MNIFDIIIASLLLFGFIRGIMKGLFVEIASLVGLIAGVYGAIHFSYFIKNYLQESVNWKPEYISLTAFAGTFIIIVIAISLLGKVLTKIADFAALGLLNKFLGGIFGALKIGLILSVVFMVLNKINGTIPFIEGDILKKSILYEPVKKVVPSVFPELTQEKDPKKSLLKKIAFNIILVDLYC